jgi:hypothetical protein
MWISGGSYSDDLLKMLDFKNGAFKKRKKGNHEIFTY